MRIYSFVDNELPDYIMVMLANHKTIHQINNDLKLFLGGNTERFTTWLQGAITSPRVLDSEQKEDGVCVHVGVCVCRCILHVKGDICCLVPRPPILS